MLLGKGNIPDASVRSSTQNKFGVAQDRFRVSTALSPSPADYAPKTGFLDNMNA